MKDAYIRKANVVRVVDGDTLDLQVDLGFYSFVRVRVRLEDVNTPEVFGVKKGSDEYLRGVQASQETLEWVQTYCPGNEVVVKTRKTGKYGRWIAEIYDPSTTYNLNEYLRGLGYVRS